MDKDKKENSNDEKEYMEEQNKNDFDNKKMIKSIIKEILEWIYCIVIAIVIAVLIKYYIGTPTVVNMSSMYPTLEESDRLILNRIDRTMKKMPQRGDIITFEAPTGDASSVNIENPIAVYEYEPDGWWNKFVYYVLEFGKISYIKRVIGLPGEHVEIKNDKVYIDGEELEEDYLNPSVKTPISGPCYDFVVPENCVFAMGDNRTNSTDCREFGCVPLEKIESKVLFRFFPFNKFGSVE